MPNFKVNVDFPRQIAQADSADLTLTVDADLTGYKCRCEFFDRDGNSKKLATVNAGGADTQVLISAGASSSTITIYLPKDETDDFNCRSYIEVEIEDSNGKVYTIYKDEFKMLQEQITWTTP